MPSASRTGFDPLAATAAVITLVMLAVYVTLIRQQGGLVAGWFVGAMAIAAILGSYGAARAAPRRVPALAVSGAMLALLGFAGILSIGLPILGAGVLALVAAGRAGRGPA